MPIRFSSVIYSKQCRWSSSTSNLQPLRRPLLAELSSHSKFSPRAARTSSISSAKPRSSHLRLICDRIADLFRTTYGDRFPLVALSSRCSSACTQPLDHAPLSAIPRPHRHLCGMPRRLLQILQTTQTTILRVEQAPFLPMARAATAALLTHIGAAIAKQRAHLRRRQQ